MEVSLAEWRFPFSDFCIRHEVGFQSHRRIDFGRCDRAICIGELRDCHTCLILTATVARVSLSKCGVLFSAHQNYDLTLSKYQANIQTKKLPEEACESVHFLGEFLRPHVFHSGVWNVCRQWILCGQRPQLVSIFCSRVH